MAENQVFYSELGWPIREAREKIGIAQEILGLIFCSGGGFNLAVG